jgi:lipopolysaccharide biosynthesis regulator YciM
MEKLVLSTRPIAPARYKNRERLASPRATTNPASPTPRNVVLSVLLAVATVALYIPVMGHSFIVLDDREYVVANPHVQTGLSWSTVKWAFTSLEAANWHPLTWLSHALDYQLFALNPAGHHFDSVLIHALNASLLFLVLSSITKRAGPSFLVAALFAVHPINVESVAWVAERKNVLSTLFFLLSIGAYAWYAHKPNWRRYLLVAGLFVAGLMAKPMVITLPFVLLLLDYWPLGRTEFNRALTRAVASNGAPHMAFSTLLLEKIPLLFLSAASAWVTLKAQRSVVRSFEELPLGLRIENAVVAYGLYLWKMLWPARLAFYPHSVTQLPPWQWILSALVLISITTLVVTFRRKRYLAVGWFWFLGTLIPVIGLVQVGEYAMADRYAYIPLIGIFVIVAWSLSDWAETKKIPAVWQVIPAVCVLMALSTVTYRQMSYWQSDYDLWSHALDVRESPLAHNALGVALMHPESAMTQEDLDNVGAEQNRLDEARRHFEGALELRTAWAQNDSAVSLADEARTLNNLGNIDRLENRAAEGSQHSEEALKIYRQLAQQNPDGYLPYLAATLNNVGSLDRIQNRMDEAREHEEQAVKIYRQLAQQNPAKYLPNVAMTLNELGLLNTAQNRPEEALGRYEDAVKIDRQLAEQSPAAYLPDLAMTLTSFGRADAMQNRMAEARQHFDEALKIDRQLSQQNPSVYLPGLAMILTNLARVDRIENKIEDSRAHYQEALSLLRQLPQSDPGYAGEVANLEASLAELNKKATPNR